MKDRTKHAARMLDAYGAAMRGDWSVIDGRTVKYHLATISAYLLGAIDEVKLSDLGICMMEGSDPHWAGPYGHEYYHEGECTWML